MDNATSKVAFATENCNIPVMCLTRLVDVSEVKLLLLILALLSSFKLDNPGLLRSFLKFPSSNGCKTLLPRPLTMNLTKSFLFVNLHLRNHMMIT